MVPKGTVVQTYPFYDGNIEFSLSESDRFVVGCTKSPVVYEFWKYAFEDAKRVAEISEQLFPILNENTFDIIKEEWHSYKDPFIRSAFFFLATSSSSAILFLSGHWLMA